MDSCPSVSVVIPAKDEQGSIGPLIAETHRILREHTNFEIVVVDDGSNDLTSGAALVAAREAGCAIQVVRHAQSIGQSGAIQTGIRAARGELIVTMDGDGQNDPADIPTLLSQAANLQGKDFCIAGFRHKRKDTAWKRFQSRLANRIRSALLKDGVPDTGCGLKLFPKSTFLKLPWFNHGHRFIPALVKGIGGDIEIVQVNHRDRTRGNSKYNVWNRAWAGLIDLAGVMWLLHRTRVAQIVEPRDMGPG
ncbi:glycosyltransferase family 2 protein [Marinobacter nanhaiticus D15-8W]|uniref:Glycosyltransferase family 2 protein n=1 Tax=Marinobacter nanhaiticus D15-8W TaxID=626887 RepID=N6WY15_9GAMM|nr:glycosyltransferase family 2 protein [Marinobacter nanhaiticus]ENO16496.1 glycosyltransferase family 2 protein [Marinobacter nanhaiticus D15-8W]BES72285.1 glycosyltransferase family 2 protein [Marinobacter nanhaiticus D15-8W]